MIESDSDMSDTEIKLEDEADDPNWADKSWTGWDDPGDKRHSSFQMSSLGGKVGADEEAGDEDDEVPESGVSKKYTDRALAMHHLKQIVGTRNLNRRIKRVKGVNTKEDAEQWLRNKGLDKKGYKVRARDIDKDGISDILIKTANGQLVVVNGYTVKPSDFVYRQYYDMLKPEQRQGTSNYKEYFNRLYDTDYKPDGTPIFRGMAPGSDNDTFGRALKKRGIRQYVPRRRSPYQTFTVLANQLFNKVAKEEPRLLTQTGKRPQSAWLAAIAYVWTHGIVKSVLEGSFDKSNAGKVLARNPKAYPNTRNSRRFKEEIKQVVMFLATQSNDPEVKNVQHALIEKAIEFTADYNRRYVL